MIEEAVKIHDRFQFEIKLNYEFGDDYSGSSYDIDTYLFIPDSLKVNPNTYRKEDFYSAIQTYIRFKTPSVPLGQIASDKKSPLAVLLDSLRRAVSLPGATAGPEFQHNIKMFCCILKSSLRDYIKAVGDLTEENEVISGLSDYLSDINKILIQYREPVGSIDFASIDKGVTSNYFFADEYISILIESYTYRLLEAIENKKAIKKRFSKELLTLIKDEAEYRKKRQFRSVYRENSDNEELIYRMSVFKKYMGSVLFLNTRVQREGKVMEQLVSGLAAGLAMIFATAIAFYALRQYGNITAPLFVALVISYIFKDRIKEIARLYLSRKIRRFLHDHKMTIFSGRKNKLGTFEESFNFIPEKNVPAPVRKLRDKNHLTEMESDWVGEKVILYRKHVHLLPGKLSDEYQEYRLEAINDIARFDIHRYLGKMDDPRKTLFTLSEGGYRKTHGERVYHLNMIIRYSRNSHALYKRFRIVLNRSGIKRIEQVYPVPKKSGKLEPSEQIQSV